MAEDALLSLSPEALRFTLYFALAVLGAVGTLVIRWGIAHLDNLGRRLKRIEFWLSKQLGFEPDD